MARIDDLIDDVVDAAKEVVSCFEWGSGTGSAERELEKAKRELREYVNGLWTAVELKEGAEIVYLAVHAVSWNTRNDPRIGFVQSYVESEPDET